MGSYTNNQNFYLIDESELVYVEGDLNYNLRRGDERIRPLVEYQITDVPSVSDSSLPKDIGFKWYKTYTNAIWNYHVSPSTGVAGVFQDPNAQVDTWTVSGLSFESGYQSANLEESRTAYSIFNGFVRLRGRVVKSDGSAFTTNTAVNFLNLPDAALPQKQKYFFVHGGNAGSTDFQTFRIFIPNVGAGDKRIEFCAYGAAGSPASERYISLNDIYYPLDDSVV